MKKKPFVIPACVAVVLAVCLGLRVGLAAWENYALREGFVPSGEHTSYQEQVPLEEMDLTQYGFLWEVMATADYKPMDFTVQRDIVYYEEPGGAAAYTIPAGTRLWWDSFIDCVSTYPTYERGWRWARPLAQEGELLPEDHYYIPLESLQAAARDLFATNENVERYRREAGLSVEEAARQMLLRTDAIFYEKGVYLSPDLTRPLWGWDCTLLAAVCAFSLAAFLRARRQK